MSNKHIAAIIAFTAALSSFSGIALAENEKATDETVTVEVSLSEETAGGEDAVRDAVEQDEDEDKDESGKKSEKKDKKNKSEKKSKHDNDDDDDDDDDDNDDDDDDDKDKKNKAEKTGLFDGIKSHVRESVSKIKNDITKSVKDLLKEIKKLFKEATKEERKEILADIAEMKKEMGDDSIDVFVGGEEIDFSNYDNVEPVIRNDVTLIPARAVAEAMGAKVSWDGETRTVTVEKDNTSIVLVIDSAAAKVNGKDYTLVSAPAIENGRTLLPLRFISESMDSTVEWDDASRTIEID